MSWTDKYKDRRDSIELFPSFEFFPFKLLWKILLSTFNSFGTVQIHYRCRLRFARYDILTEVYNIIPEATIESTELQITEDTYEPQRHSFENEHVVRSHR